MLRAPAAQPESRQMSATVLALRVRVDIPFFSLSCPDRCPGQRTPNESHRPPARQDSRKSERPPRAPEPSLGQGPI